MAKPHGRDDATQSQAEPSASGSERCSWFSSGKRCLLPASISPDIGDRRRQFCHWHFVCLTHVGFATDFDEFVKWNAVWKNYCSLENHYPIEMVWRAIIGLEPLSGLPSVCLNKLCRYRMMSQAEIKKKALAKAVEQAQEVVPF